MEIHQLHCFVAVVEEGGFNRATARLHKTQPAISYHIKQLEAALGTPLLHRHSRGVSPTEAGRVLFHHAQEILEIVRRTEQALEQLSDGVSGDIRIGTVNSVGIYFLPEVLRTMREKYPDARPTVLYRNSPEVMDALLSNRIDLAILPNPSPDRRLRQEVLIAEAVSLVCAHAHPLFNQFEVRPTDLRGQQFIALTRESPTGQLIHDYLTRMGVDVEPVVTTDNVETVKKMVEVGLGVALLPDMVTSPEIGCMGQPRGDFIRIEIGPPLTRRIVLVTWRQRPPTPTVAAFIEELRQHSGRWKGCVDGDGDQPTAIQRGLRQVDGSGPAQE